MECLGCGRRRSWPWPRVVCKACQVELWTLGVRTTEAMLAYFYEEYWRTV